MTSRGSKADNEVSDLKKEVMSLKTLLLSSRSFPQNPSIIMNTSLSPSIPSWQLDNTTTIAASSRQIKSEKSSVTEEDEEVASPPAGQTWEAGSSGNGSSSEIEMISHESSSGG